MAAGPLLGDEQEVVEEEQVPLLGLDALWVGEKKETNVKETQFKKTHIKKHR